MTDETKKLFIQIDKWFFPLQSIVFHRSGSTVEIYPVNSTKLLISYDGEQAQRLLEWLIHNSEDVTAVE